MIIYKITNLINGKIYIGQTQKTLEERMQGHKHGKILIDDEIKKYGIENFSYEVVEKCQTIDELNEREKFWIEKLNCKYPNGYNVDDGGGGFTCKRKDKINFNSKVKIVGTREFLDVDTNEVENFQVIEMQEADFNFNKIWVSNVIQALELVGNAKTKLLFWLIENKDYNNKVTYTYEQISKATGISLKTVRITMKALMECKFMVKHHAGCYIINPNFIRMRRNTPSFSYGDISCNS